MPIEVPPPPALVLVGHRSHGAGSEPSVRLQQPPQTAEQVPRVDIAIEVVGNLPLQDKLLDYSQRLTRRQLAGSINRRYSPTILELITLVKRNPEKPAGKAWDSIGALNLRFNEETRYVTVEYCVEHCEFDARTGAFAPGRRMASYSAPEAQVTYKLNKKLDGLKKYAPSPDPER